MWGEHERVVWCINVPYYYATVRLHGSNRLRVSIPGLDVVTSSFSGLFEVL